MSLPDNDYQILKLTQKFYETYPNPPYTEILKKEKRAYNCLLFQTHYKYFICIPYRTEVTHKYAFHFRGTSRSKNHKSALDYTKMVIVNRGEFLNTTDALIDKDEFNETMRNLEEIKQNALSFLEDYINHVDGTSVLHPREFKRRYNYSPLKYFHSEMGINK